MNNLIKSETKKGERTKPIEKKSLLNDEGFMMQQKK